MTNFYTSFHIHRGKILLRGVVNGKRFQQRNKLKPYLFVPTKAETPYRTLDGRPVGKMDFDTPWEANEFKKKYTGVHGFEFFGLTKFEYPFINDEYPGEIQFDPKHIVVANTDIEVASDKGFPSIEKADKAITAITVNVKEDYYVFGCGEFKTDDPRVHYCKCADEAELLAKFILFWMNLRPDVITGWYVRFFDIPYLYNRITRVLGKAEADKLSPWGIVEEQIVKFSNRELKTYVIYGVSTLDYQELYKKFKFENQEEWTLNHISYVELGEGKLDYSEHRSLQDLYAKDYQKFIEYNIRDTNLINKLEKKLGFLFQVYAVAFAAKVSFVDTLTTVRLWDVIIHNYLMDQKIVVPQFEVADKEDEFEGAYVKEPVPAMYRMVASFDLTSLYPKTIIQYNISPETLVGKLPKDYTIDEIIGGAFEQDDLCQKLKDSNLCVTGAGYIFTKEKQGFLPALMEKIFAERDMYKKRMIEAEKRYEKTHDPADEEEQVRYHNFQLARKIMMNSMYGALGNVGCRWYDLRLAESITLSAQLATRWVIEHVNIFMNRKVKAA